MLLRDRTPRPAPGRDPRPVGASGAPAVSLYGFEAHDGWASAMLHNRSPRSIADAVPFVIDDDLALIGRREGMALSPGALVQVTFPGAVARAPSPSQCLVEFTDHRGRPWVVGLDRPAPRPIVP